MDSRRYHYPDTCIAGCYNWLQTEILAATVENESSANALSP
jgi:hypothetical protein